MSWRISTVWREKFCIWKGFKRQSKTNMGCKVVSAATLTLLSGSPEGHLIGSLTGKTVQITRRRETGKNVWCFHKKQTESSIWRTTLPVFFTPLDWCCADPGAEGRHPPAWLLLPRRGGRGWDHGKRLVRAPRHRVSAAPGPSAELPGSGEDQRRHCGECSWCQCFCHASSALVFSPHGIPAAHFRWWEANIFDCTPLRTRRSCTLINPSSFTTPVRWDRQSVEMWGAHTHTQHYKCAALSMQVEVENPDLERFPQFAKAPYQECVLQPGDVLFIPVRHWHYVRSLELSFSVSFWWSWQQIPNKGVNLCVSPRRNKKCEFDSFSWRSGGESINSL